ncbi:hypothetical protein [Leptospira ainazelensis]|uniref:hypothetical protein n=1 Tax=Leptospira ainazelensis TaxID=2810034 RepID=UPI001964D8CF|nr:hypothetical protein [Leptospira ainazelensis]
MQIRLWFFLRGMFFFLHNLRHESNLRFFATSSAYGIFSVPGISILLTRFDCLKFHSQEWMTLTK